MPRRSPPARQTTKTDVPLSPRGLVAVYAALYYTPLNSSQRVIAEGDGAWREEGCGRYIAATLHAHRALRCYTSWIVTRRPTMAAARWRLDSVMSSLASSSRSTCVRLVFSSVAMRFFDIFFSFIAWASCHATPSLTACACASSKTPSSFRKSSMLEPCVSCSLH